MTTKYVFDVLSEEYKRHADHAGTTLVVFDKRAHSLYSSLAKAAGAVPCVMEDAKREFERVKADRILVTSEDVREPSLYAGLDWAKRLGVPIVICRPGRLIQRSKVSWEGSGITYGGIFYLAGQYTQTIRCEEGTFCEFGVFDGRTFSIAYHALLGACSKYYAFDSFQGIGQSTLEENTHFRDGDYYANEETVWCNVEDAGVDVNRVTAVAGFFEQSLSGKTPMSFGINHIKCAHIDVDVYSPAIHALRFITPALCDGALLLFDDYDQLSADDKRGERRAFGEWLTETGFRAEPYRNYAVFGRSFIIHKD